MLRTRQTPNRIVIPTPTVAQCAYGAATVVLSTLAMLLLTQTASPLWVGVIACAGLGLGLLVATRVPGPRTGRAGKVPERADETPAAPAPAPAPAAGTYEGARVPGPRARPSVAEHSLRG
jgi:hypothetical protein